jgi:hypothetical protein
MKRLISRFLLSAVVPLGCVALFASPCLAATVSLPSAFTFGNKSFNQVYTNDNGTLSFGNEYIASGPGTNFLAPPSSVQGIIAAGFGDYSTTSNWTVTSLVNGTKFDFSGFDSLANGTNSFSVSLLNDSAFQIVWNTITPSTPFGSIAIGLYVPGVLNNNELDPAANTTLALDTVFFFDYSLIENGAADPSGGGSQGGLSGKSLNGSFTVVPEPTTLSGLLALGSTGLALRLKRSSKKAS